MIDIHCHALFGVDDASVSIDQAIAMIEDAAKDGIQAILITPHCIPGGRYENSSETMSQPFIELKHAIKQRGINLEIYLGCEFMMSETAPAWMVEKGVVTLNNTHRVLVELPWNRTVNRLMSVHELVAFVISQGYRPLIAHPERYASVQENLDVLAQFREMGCDFQVNSTSILSPNEKERELCQRIIESGYCDVIASDAHNSTTRPIHLSTVYHHISSTYGEDVAHLMLCDNPRRIIEGEPCLTYQVK